MLRPPARLPEILRAELVPLGNHRRSHGSIFMRALRPRQSTFAIDPDGESHTFS